MTYMNDYINDKLNTAFLEGLKGKYSKELPIYICSEIGQFLAEDSKDSNSILWIQLPVERFSTNSKTNERIYIELYGALIQFLRCSLQTVEYIPSLLDYPGKWYFGNDSFFLIPNDNEPFYFLKTKSQDSLQLSFDWENRSDRGRCALKIGHKQEIIKQAKAIYKITSHPKQSNINRVAKQCSEEIKALELTSMYQVSFSSAMVMCSSIPYDVRRYAGKYIFPVVELLNTESAVPDNIDVAVLWGNNTLDRVQDFVNRLQANELGTIKKLVYVGPMANDYLIYQNPKILTLPFDFVRKCIEPEKQTQPTLEVKTIDFPWLNKALLSLESILEAQKEADIIAPEHKKYIYNFFRRQFCDFRFTPERFTNLKDRSQDFIEDVFNGYPPYEIVQGIDEWISNLDNPPKDNPKQQLAQKLKVSFAVTPRRSIRRQTKDVTKKSGKVIIDAPVYRIKDFHYGNAIFDLWRYLPYYSIVAIYYSQIEDIPRQSLNGLSKSPILGTRIKRIEKGATDQMLSDSFDQVLDEYLYYNESQHIYTDSIYSRPTCVTFEDHTSANIFGHVIVHLADGNLERKNILDLSDSDLGNIITYYISDNELYSTLMRHALPTGKSVEDYSAIWKNALRRYVESMTKDERNAFCKRFGISMAILKNQVDGTSKFMQKEAKMKPILDLLISEKIVSDEDAKYILAARLCLKSTSISFGAKLKEDLLSYYMSKEL